MASEPFLTVGKARTGELVSIDTQRSGVCELVCPFCSRALVAVRGQVRIHHFRHDGATCRESKRPLSLIPGWDHFNLSLSASVVDELLHQTSKSYFPTYLSRKPSLMIGRMERYGLIEHGFMGHWQLTDTAQVVTGMLTLSKFDPWLRRRLQERLSEKRELVAAGQLHPAHFQVEASRQEQILSATLYLFELVSSDGTTFYKIGRTLRSVEQRLAEVSRDMTATLNVPIQGKILKAIEGAGHIEKYTLWKYRASLLAIGRYQEYLQLVPGDLRGLKSELTRFENSRDAFNESEVVIVSGKWTNEDIEPGPAGDPG